MSELIISNLKIKNNDGRLLVDSAGFTLKRGQITALIGPSGCGKTLTALATMRLLPGSLNVSGSIKLNDKELVGLPEDDIRKLRGKEIAYTMQNASALNPSIKIKKQIKEGNKLVTHEDIKMLISKVGLNEHILNLYPHQLSGGMRQRVLLAISLADKPSFLIADEPTNGLDTTVAQQVLRLLADLSADHKLGLLLITHDLAIVAQLAERIAIMHSGSIVEYGSMDSIFKKSLHPYTNALLGKSDKDKSNFGNRSGVNNGSGCCYAQQCLIKTIECLKNKPILNGDKNHKVACFKC